MNSFSISTFVAALLVTTGAAIAADTVVSEAPPAPPEAPAAFSWTGFYVGGFGTLAVGDMEYGTRQIFADGNPPPQIGNFDVSASGFLGGIQAGYDWQMNDKWVVGAVADIAGSNYSASITASSNGVEFLDGESKLKYLGTVRARVGYAWDRALLYAHGGLAYGKTEHRLDLGGTNVFSESQTRTGWTVGAGVEYAITDRISFGTEYAFVDLGAKQILDNGEGLTINDDVDLHTLKAFVNFRF
ncbi:porin family protein [Mesorhizobium sp. VK25A]|uniref:Porin family protein n=1 Tax=Mesorhizobium vachelliae TaxID=3072309 RepID=A0ABU5A4P7_9HYPH|nr:MULTISPECIES: outer membrane protein [unclassified Mesorhizobium]MDX8531176.1 porin family protein [Mesorhizobium sp. VK25D]MDX8543073.1 porin family protein [Mesorhizobium sp. VK25A]